jgi:hypothetical protein
MKSLIQHIAEVEGIDEKLVKKIIFRKGKRLVVRRTDKPGYKTVNGKEVRVGAQERLKKSKGAKRAAKKRKSKTAAMKVMRNRSLRKRKASGQ